MLSFDPLHSPGGPCGPRTPHCILGYPRSRSQRFMEYHQFILVSSSAGGGSLIPWNNNLGSSAVFSALNLSATGSFAVTLDANVRVGNLTYRGGNPGSTLQIAVGLGNTITMGALQMNVSVDAGTTLVIAPVIADAFFFGRNRQTRHRALILQPQWSQ